MNVARSLFVDRQNRSDDLHCETNMVQTWPIFRRESKTKLTSSKIVNMICKFNNLICIAPNTCLAALCALLRPIILAATSVIKSDNALAHRDGVTRVQSVGHELTWNKGLDFASSVQLGF